MTLQENRLLGSAPPLVTRLGLGLAALGRPGYINVGHGADLGTEKSVEAMRANAHAVLDEAWAAGIRYFDAARSYGLAEEFLGNWLAQRGYAATVGSKWGYTYTADWHTEAEQHEVKDHTLATLQRQWPETLAALRRTPDLYLIHSATLETGVLDDLRVLARLAELGASGVRVGLSLSGPAQATTLRRALEVRVDGVNPLSVVQATWNPLEPSAGAALAEAHAAGWARGGQGSGRQWPPDHPRRPSSTHHRPVCPPAHHPRRAGIGRRPRATVGRYRAAAAQPHRSSFAATSGP